MEQLVDKGFAGTKRFEILRCLGVGGFGAVYCAFDRRRHEQVALKVLHQRDADALYRFKREFRALADLSHPNLVGLRELFSDGVQWFFTMELLDGTDFLSFVRGQELPWDAFSPTRIGETKRSAPGDARVDGEPQGADIPSDGFVPLVSGPPERPALSSHEPPASAGRVRLAAAPTMPRAGVRQSVTMESPQPPHAAEPGPATEPAVHDESAGATPNDRGAIVDLTQAMAERLRGVLPQIVRGVHALHRAGQLHRDIKPSNVLVTRQGRLALLDFGLVAELGAARAGREPVMGTVGYMAPEQLMGGEVGRASDWYAVGAMLYEAIADRLPHEGDPHEVARAKLLDEPMPIGQLVPSCPADLAQLTMQLLARDPDLRPTGAQLLARLGEPAPVGELGSRSSVYPVGSMAPAEGPFVGRESELGVLRDALASAGAGRQVTVQIHGPSGIGKSGLVAHFVREAQREQGALVLRGRCDERESVPFKALDRLLDELCAYLQALPAAQGTVLMPRHIHALARLFPVLRGVPAVQRAPGSERESRADPLELRRLGCAALRELLARLCDRAPVVLVLDDLQWGDLDSAQLLAEVLRRPDPPNLLLVACYRTGTEEASPFLRALLAESHGECHDVPIGALSGAEARELGRALADGPIPDQELDRIVREAHGNPFFVGELVRFLSQGRGEAPASADLSLDRVVLARIERLSPEARRLLELVAVAAGPIADTTAVEAAGLGDEARAALTALRGAYLVRASAFDEGAIETYHDRIRETVVTSLDGASLRELHEKLAHAFEATGTAEPERLIHHYRGAGDAARAGELALAAARASAEGLAFDRAVTHFRLALELQPLGPADLLCVRSELGDALANAGRGPEAAAEFLGAAALADGMAALELRQKASLQLLVTGRIDEGLEVMGPLLPVYGLRLRRNPQMAALSLFLRRARLFLRGLDFEERSADDIAPSTLRRIDSLATLSHGLALVDVIRGSDMLTQALLLSLEAGEPTRIVEMLWGEVNFSASEGSRAYRRTRRLLDRLRRLAERYDSPKARGLVHLGAAFTYHLGSHEFTEALEEYRASQRTLADCPGAGWERDTAGLMMLDLYWYTGRLRELESLGDELLREARQRGNRYVSYAVYTSASHMIWLAGDRPEELRELVDRSVREWSQSGFHLQHWWELWALTQIDLYTGNGQAALDRLRARWRAIRRSLLLTVQIVRIEAVCALGRAWLSCCLEATGAARRRAEREALRCARRLEKEGPAWIGALGKLLRAAVLAARDPAHARELLEQSRQAFESNGMQLYAAVSRYRLGELSGGDVGRGLCERAEEYFRTEGVRDPRAMAALLAPGFAPPPAELGAAAEPPRLSAKRER